jgi:hypothetical protein
MICQDIMTDEPQQQPQSQPQQQPRRDAQRHHGRPQHRQYRDQRQRSPENQQSAPAEAIETKTPGLDDADTEEETATRQSQPRSHRGRPEKKKYEEWANDPYCN